MSYKYALITLLFYFGCQANVSQENKTQKPVMNTVRYFNTNEWQVPGALFLRYGARNDILIRHKSSDIIYSIVLDSMQFRRQPKEIWDSASTVVTDCDAQPKTVASGFDYDRDKGILLVDKTKVETAGEVVLAVVQSPSKKMISVLSAEERKRSLLPFYGKSIGLGKHYHELIDVSSKTQINDFLLLPIGGPKESLQICWIHDEKYLLYADILRFRLVIVPGR